MDTKDTISLNLHSVEDLLQNMDEIEPDSLTLEEMLILRASTIYSGIESNISNTAHPYTKVYSDPEKTTFLLELTEDRHHILVGRFLTEEMEAFAKRTLGEPFKYKALPFYSPNDEFITNIGYIRILDGNDRESDYFFTFRLIS